MSPYRFKKNVRKYGLILLALLFLAPQTTYL